MFLLNYRCNMLVPVKEKTLAAIWVEKLKKNPDRFLEFWIGLSKNYDLIKKQGQLKEKDNTIFYLKFKDESFICSKGHEFWEENNMIHDFPKNENK